MSDVRIMKFSATWCGPCKMLKQVFDRVVKDKNYDVVEFDADEQSAEFALHNVTSVPTIIVFVNGNEINRIVGFRPDAILKKEIIDKIEVNL